MSNETVEPLDYSSIVAVKAITEPLKTEGLFDITFVEKDSSPIDQFINNVNALNRIWNGAEDKSSTLPRELATIVFLGYMSAVESYVRAIVRGVIQVDPQSQKFAETKMITFGAALHHNKKLLPEALMDEDSFVSAENISSTFKSLVGLNIGWDERVSSEFNNICQLRHCCVHRFGKLGAKNAIKLGLDAHGKLFEKPLSLSRGNLELIALNIRSIVKYLNNIIYKAVIDRTYPIPKNNDERKKLPPLIWSNDYSKDKMTYLKYYKLFATKDDSIKTQAAKIMYNAFINQKKKDLADRKV